MMSLPYHKNQKLPNKKKVLKEISYSRYALRGMQLSDPEPVSYQRNLFKPCTMSKIIDVPRRFQDGFMSPEEVLTQQIQRGIIIHTDRYSRLGHKESSKTQNERLAEEEDFVRKARILKQKTEMRMRRQQNQTLLLEGENVMPSQLRESRSLMPVVNDEKRRLLHSQLDELFNGGLKAPDPSPFPEDDEAPVVIYSSPVSMEVYKIKLRNRRLQQGSDMDECSNEKVDQHQHGRTGHEKLPPLGESENFLSSFNYESAFRQSDKFGQSATANPLARCVMDGVAIKYTERADFQSEIKYLKSLLLPKVAKDLYVGRGIQLPRSHATNHPRLPGVENGSRQMTTQRGQFEMQTSGGGSITVNSATPVTSPIKNQDVNLLPTPISPENDFVESGAPGLATTNSTANDEEFSTEPIAIADQTENE